MIACYISRVKRKSKVPLPQRAARRLARLKRVRGLSDAEKSVYALGLAAPPEERWQLNENLIRSLGYWKPSKRKISGSSQACSPGFIPFPPAHGDRNRKIPVQAKLAPARPYGMMFR